MMRHLLGEMLCLVVPPSDALGRMHGYRYHTIDIGKSLCSSQSPAEQCTGPIGHIHPALVLHGVNTALHHRILAVQPECSSRP